MRMVRGLAMVGLLGVLLANQLGCLAVAAGAGAGAAAMHYRAPLRVTLDATPERVMAAAERAVSEMELSLISFESSALDGELIARTAKDVRVTVVAKSRTETTSDVSIRVGRFGDDDMSQRVLDRIRANL